MKQLLGSPHLENSGIEACTCTPVNKLVITQILVFRPLWTFDKERCLSVTFSVYQELPLRGAASRYTSYLYKQLFSFDELVTQPVTKSITAGIIPTNTSRTEPFSRSDVQQERRGLQH